MSEESKQFDEHSNNSELTRTIVKILLGIPNQTGKTFKTNKFWDRHFRCDYRELFEVVYEGLQNSNFGKGGKRK